MVIEARINGRRNLLQCFHHLLGEIADIHFCFSDVNKQMIWSGFFVIGEYKKNLLNSAGIAERQGFEPWEQLPVHRISSAARSTTPASFLAYAPQR